MDHLWEKVSPTHPSNPMVRKRTEHKYSFKNADSQDLYPEILIR